MHMVCPMDVCLMMYSLGVSSNSCPAPMVKTMLGRELILLHSMMYWREEGGRGGGREGRREGGGGRREGGEEGVHE